MVYILYAVIGFDQYKYTHCDNENEKRKIEEEETLDHKRNWNIYLLLGSTEFVREKH